MSRKIMGVTVPTPLKPQENEIFIAEYGVTTFNELRQAVIAGKIIFCKDDLNIAPMISRKGYVGYNFMWVNNSKVVRYYLSGGTWGKEETIIPNQTSDLNNNSGFITNAVNDLVNYYTKSETMSKDEINARISAIPKFTVTLLEGWDTNNMPPNPQSMLHMNAYAIYIVPNGDESGNMYDEYIIIGDEWEKLGTQKFDLTGYLNVDNLDLTYGIYYDNEKLKLNCANADHIETRSGAYYPITPPMIDFAVMSSLTNPISHDWTEEEKNSARELLNALPMPPQTSGMWVLAYDATNKVTSVYNVSQNSPGVGQVVITTHDKTVRTETPVNDLDATNKKYVDALIDRIAVLERRDKKLYFTDYSFDDFGIPNGTYTNTKEDDPNVTTTFPTNMDGVRFSAKVSLGSEGAEVRLFGLRDNGWQSPISFKITNGELYAVDCVTQSDNTAGRYTIKLGECAVGETFDITIELEALGQHMKAYFYLNGEYVASQVYYGYTAIFSRDIIIYARENNQITVTSV